jgi:hypothetical protein
MGQIIPSLDPLVQGLAVAFHRTDLPDPQGDLPRLALVCRSADRVSARDRVAAALVPGEHREIGTLGVADAERGQPEGGGADGGSDPRPGGQSSS